MRINALLVSIGLASQVTYVHGYRGFRAIPAERHRNLLVDWPYAFLVSHVGKANGQDWCITAKYGTATGSNIGFDLCDFGSVPNNQLFLLDRIGKIHTKLDPLQCLAVDPATEIHGGSRIKMCGCDEPAAYNRFTHSRGTDNVIGVNNTTYCIKQTGSGPDTTDTLRTEICEETNPCFIYDYLEHGCTTSMRDVECCNTADCSSTDICNNRYQCVCSTSRPNVNCCTNADCPQGGVCNNYSCVNDSPTLPPPPPVPSDFFECYNNTNCPTGYTCEANWCVSSAFFLASNIDTQNWCVSANNGLDEFEDVGTEYCEFTNAPARQLWRRDTHYMIHSNLNMNRCIVVGPGVDIQGGLHIHIASCRLNMFLYDEDTKLIHLGEDPAFCLLHDSSEGRMCGKPCGNAENFNFTMEEPPV